MSQKIQTIYHRFENNITIDIIGGRIVVTDILDCDYGIREDIHIETDGEIVKIEGTVLPNGFKEVKAYRNGKLVKHILGENVLY